ncbi:MAG: twin-arginine translocase TatA/TatE family subunit [Candidatus Hydrogenedentota bacterium]
MGIGEMIVIAGIALVIIGPEKFPEFAKICVRTIRDLRSYVEETKDDLRKELTPVKKEIDEVSRYDPESYIDALTDSRDESDYYNEGYEQETSESDTDDEGYKAYGANEQASETAEETPANEETASQSTEEPSTKAPESEESQPESKSPDEEDIDIPKPMDG